MTCSQWQFVLTTAEASELAENVALQEHLACCDACSQVARDMEALTRATRSLPRLSSSPDFGAQVRRRIDDTRTRATARPAVLSFAFQPQAALVRGLVWLVLAVGLAAACYPLTQ